jgi:hypothetical protein
MADVLEFIDDPSMFKLAVDGHEVEFLDESGLSCGGNDEFFVCGHEFGATHLIHARSFEDAWEAWIDACSTIPASELPAAYGVSNSPEIKVWKEANPSPGYRTPEWETWCDALRAKEFRILEAWGQAADDGGEYPELIEGYEMQSNASGTGIVNVGHYAWLDAADLSQVDISRKEGVES